jgi:hypothetical protein
MAKTHTEKLKELAADTASATHKGLSSAQEVASKAGVAALAAGRSVQQAVGDAVEHDNTQAVVAKVKGLAESATQGAKKLTDRVVDTVKAADANHKDVAEKVEAVSMGLGITSGAVAVGAALAAPTGLGAVGVALGVTSAPLIVTAAPIIGAAATAAGVVSGGLISIPNGRPSRRMRMVRTSRNFL